MTDENEALRRRVAELEKQLVEARPRSVVELELRRRGLAASAIPDAMELLKATHTPSTPEKLTTESVWFTEGDPELKTLTELIDTFAEGRGYLFPATERPAPTYAPTYPDGREVPVPAMTDVELSIAAGAFPEAQPAKLPTYTPEQLEAMNDLDRLAIEAGTAPVVERDDSDIGELNAELEARAEHRAETNKERAESGGVRMFEAKKWGKA